MNLSGTNSLYFIAIFILFINPLCLFSYKTFSYNETEPGFQVYQLLTYYDGTSVVYLNKPINGTCSEPRIILRIIHPNGTVDKAEVDYPIPDFNFCIIPNDISMSLHLVLYRHLPDYIYVLYENSTDINSASYFALHVTRTGKFISNTYISRVSVINGAFSKFGNMVLHTNEENGFLFYNPLTETITEWIYFNNSDSNGNFLPINNGRFDQEISDIFPTIDGNFGIVTRIHKSTSNSPHGLIDPTELTFELYITFIGPNKNADGPYLLYQTSIPNLQIQSSCNVAYTTRGYFCILNMKDEQNEDPKYHVIKIIFQNSGSVVDVETFSDIELYRNLNENEFVIISNVYHGGFLLTIFKDSEDTLYKTFQSVILDNNGNYNNTLDLPENIKIINNYSTGGFRNNTFVIVHQEDNYTWEIYSADIPKFTSNDNGYNNPNIKATYPSINSKIPLSLTNINITYNFQVTTSINKIFIYQVNNSDSTLRQTIPGNSLSFTYSADNRTINISILESTFNQPNAKYYIVIEDNVVNDLETNQPIIGIGSNIWEFNTVDNQDIFAEDATGRFSLTTEGTKYFKSLSSYNQTRFLLNLRVYLAKSIPLEINRLHAIKYESDKSQRILLSLSIKSTSNLNERNVDHIIKDLDLLIQYKEVTPISLFDTTNFIDASFGFQRTRNFFDDVKFHLIGIVIGVIILCLFYLYARKKHSTVKYLVMD
ncbi:11793_t:CDS:2 [Funneliformis caledonium]|uniref:11793_t:CDS:1 n=1 Tax=Funneliformis caledonium TaxID=1117310 RepID=A0A9N9GIS4_9GLOM|nr:11793_t:CDS:2 [Funneliformis caledonium]